jgi:TetR/AcrR family fatty acid metabolism transcriptional regulator
MRSNFQPVSQKKPSFIEEARRRQIVETAIQTIATQGFSQASLAEIAREAGISKGVISYHFAGKEELVQEILRSLLRQPADFIKERVGQSETALDQLRAYVDANFEFMESHRDNYVALVDLWGRRGDSEAENRFNADVYEPSRHYLAHILEAGRERGEFRHVPVRTTASLIQATIDGVMLQWVFDRASVDLDVSRAEVLEMITRHVSQGETS